jgi:molybdopterin-guanine dinucleotide biosynthesis protein B
LLTFGITGSSGSGKTTLITALIPIILARGLTVSTIKHAHHTVPLDQPGKDSFRHGAAGAQEVILATPAGFALFNQQAEPPLSALLARLAPVDLVLVEGFKTLALPRLEVYRPSRGQPPFWPAHPMQAVAADEPLPHCPVPVLPLNQPAAVVDFILGIVRLNKSGV